MMFVDSSVWIDYFNGTTSAATETLDQALGAQRIVTGDLVLVEVLQGFASERDFRKAKTVLMTLDVRSMVGPELALQAAANYRLLRQKGCTVRKTIDTLIATWCIEHRIELLHADKDFLPFEKHLKLRSALSR